MKRRLTGLFSLLAVLALALSPAAAAKKEPRIDPKDFAAFVNKTLAEWKVPGVGIAVVKGGKVVLAEGYGLRDVLEQAPGDGPDHLRHRLVLQGLHGHGRWGSWWTRARWNGTNGSGITCPRSGSRTNPPRP